MTANGSFQGFRESGSMSLLRAQSGLAEKLRLDFRKRRTTVSGMPPPLDQATADLIMQMCLEAGCIMENESTELAMVLPSSMSEIADRIARVREAGADILALAVSAEVILRRSDLGS